MKVKHECLHHEPPVNVKDPATLTLPASNLCIALCDTKDGKIAASLRIWIDRDRAQSKEPPAIELEFNDVAEILDVLAINYQMVATIAQRLNAEAVQDAGDGTVH